jgi:hypothetical protein
VANGRLVSCKLIEAHVSRLANVRTSADHVPQPRSLVLDGCPMFAASYMG